MDLSTSTTRGRVHYYTHKTTVLVLVILKDLILLLHALLVGRVTLEQLQARLQVHEPFYHAVRIEDVEPVSQSNDDFSSVHEASVTSSAPSEETWVSAVRALCRAIVKRDIELVSRILNAAPALARKPHDGKWYPLHAAVLSGDVDLVRLILAQPRVDVSATDKSSLETADTCVREEELGIRTDSTKGATPLHYACMVGNIDIIKLLLDHGATFDVEDYNGREPVEYFDVRLHAEALAAYQELFEEWQQRQNHYNASVEIDSLADMIRNNDFAAFETALRRTPKRASTFTYYNFTLLHLAVIRQRRPFVKLLLSVAPSTINTVDERNNYNSSESLESFAPSTLPHKHVKAATPLHYACLTGNLEIIELLLEAGADWEVEDYRGRKPKELIYGRGDGGERVKREFSRLRDEEEGRRRKAKEEEEEEELGKTDEEDAGEYVEEENMGSSDWKSESGSNESSETNVSSESSPTKDKVDETDKLQAPRRPLEAVLGAKLVGQRGPIRTVANAIRLRENGWVDPDRPLVMLFLGSSGVGKTELAKQVALYIHGKDGLAPDKGTSLASLERAHSFVRIDMSEFQDSHTVYNLFGSPKGYCGCEDGGSLTQALKANPRAIVLLDEIEKAHPDVLTVFLQVFDDGRITDSKDGVINCKDAVFIMTSNLASDEIKAEAPRLRALVAGTETQSRPEEYLRVVGQFTRSVHPVLKHALRRDEFLGRINQTVLFVPLDEAEIELVIKAELDVWRRRAEEKHAIKVGWADEVVQKLAMAYDVKYGVRSVANEVQRIAVQLIADAQIRGQISKNWHAYLTINELGDIVLKATDLKGRPPTDD